MQKLISKSLLLLVMLLPFANSCPSQTVETSSAVQDPNYAADYIAAKALQAALKENNRKAVAALIEYPLRRDEPLRAIKNNKEFLKHWQEYFDAASTKAVLTASAEQFGWRGVALKGGIVWFNNGHISAINLQTTAYLKAFEAAKLQDSSRLYASARGYDKITYQCRTQSRFVRIQQHGDDLRYFAWKNGSSLKAKPELELKGGKYDAQGSGGNFDLDFENNGFTYSLNVGHNLCGEDCNDHLVVQQGSKIQSSEVCTEVKP